LRYRAGRTYLAGPSLRDGLALGRRLSERGLDVTLAHWSAVTASPENVAVIYQETIAAAATLPGADVAIKVPALDSSVDLLESVARTAAEHNVRLWFDSHWPQSADETLGLARRARVDGAAVGVALPTRWERSPADVSALGGEFDVRFVKGQWADIQPLQFNPRARFCSVALGSAGRVRSVALATHDVHALHQVLPGLVASGTPVEVQLLWGLPLRRALRAAVAHETTVRIYVAFGYPYLMYSARAMWENRSVAVWLARDMLVGGHAQTRRLARIAGITGGLARH